MEFKIYKTTEDYNFDEVYEFVPIGTSSAEYSTKITIDWLDIDLEERGKVVRVSCNCQDYERRRHFCKHIKECIKILSNDKKFVLHKDMIRYWCPTCYQHCDVVNVVPKCYKCKNDMDESSTSKIPKK